MISVLPTGWLCVRRVARAALLAVSFGAGLLTACDRTPETVTPATDAETGRDFLPVTVGRYWIYDVTDRVWNYNTPRDSTYQVRERVDTVFTGADGATSYYVVRSTRATAAANWRDDSVYALSLTPQLVRRIWANVPTIELTFPVREGSVWNPNLFNRLDSTERRYVNLDQPLALAATGQSFEHTVRVEDAGEDNFYFRRTLASEYARGVGRVRRERVALEFCQSTDSTRIPGGCSLGPGYVVRGRERTELLREYGPR